MNSRESLQGASGLGLDPTAGSVLVKTPVASRREISGKLISRPLRFLYWVYEQWLLRQLQQGSMPRHVGIILDGNRRHARRRGIGDPREIYQYRSQQARRCAGLVCRAWYRCSYTLGILNRKPQAIAC